MAPTVGLLFLSIAVSSCLTPQKDRLGNGFWRATDEELASMGAALVIREVPSRSVDGFSEHWRSGTRTALHDASTVLVHDATRSAMLELSGFLSDYGGVCATGWEDGERFFVHLKRDSDAGTLVYVDLERRRVTEMVHWAGW